MELKIEKDRLDLFTLMLINWDCCGRIILQVSDWHLLFCIHCYILYSVFLEVSIVFVLASETWISGIDCYMAIGSRILPDMTQPFFMD